MVLKMMEVLDQVLMANERVYFMKELNQIKLNQQNKVGLSKKEMNKMLGGSSTCTCYIYHSSDSMSYSIEDNEVIDSGRGIGTDLFV